MAKSSVRTFLLNGLLNSCLNITELLTEDKVNLRTVFLSEDNPSELNLEDYGETKIYSCF